jgi:hypothetical protein
MEIVGSHNVMRNALLLALVTVLSAGLSATAYTFKSRPEGFARWWNASGIIIFIILWFLLALIICK